MSLSVGAIVGITLSVLALLAILVAFFVWNRYSKNTPELALDHPFVPQSTTTAAFYPIESAALSASGQDIPPDWFTPIASQSSALSSYSLGEPKTPISPGYPATPTSLKGKGYAAGNYTIKQVASGGTITSIRSPLPRLIGDPTSPYPMSATSITKVTSGMSTGPLSASSFAIASPSNLSPNTLSPNTVSTKVKSVAPSSPRYELDDPFASPLDTAT
jgi:hypothetical protein